MVKVQNTFHTTDRLLQKIDIIKNFNKRQFGKLLLYALCPPTKDIDFDKGAKGKIISFYTYSVNIYYFGTLLFYVPMAY